MLIVINAIASFLGAMIGTLAYHLATQEKKQKEVPPASFNTYQELPEAPPMPIKRKKRTADEIAIQNEKQKLQNATNGFVDQMSERVTLINQ